MWQPVRSHQMKFARIEYAGTLDKEPVKLSESWKQYYLLWCSQSPKFCDTTLPTSGENEKPEEGKPSTVKDISLIERIISVIGAMASGLFYGTMWLPVNYMMSHHEKFPDAPTNPLHYFFSYTCGILSTSVCIFVIYAIVRRNRPWVSSNAIIPALSTGLCYGCAMSAFVVAIDKLDAAIAYPIGQMAPGLVVSTWSLLYYREIMGRRNLLILACAYLLTVAGVIIVTISKEVKVF
ncbi:unnamed protein product [Cylicocyclus nassatus]|uniref:Transmembrane protein 144 n=1 Tax=Cylicocyclus nassatus TaxID=53992 RepID=A0AA36GL67_CYLNA|nr:unnamed protein product [Cylicocyclus nassatus]